MKRLASFVGHVPTSHTFTISTRRATSPPRVRRDAEARPEGLTVAELAQLVEARRKHH